MIVENRGAIIAVETVAKAPPDGYTLLVIRQWFLDRAVAGRQPAYDPVKDFSPITLADTSPNVLVVHPSLPVKSVKELIALAKARPGELNYASAITGGHHLISRGNYSSPWRASISCAFLTKAAGRPSTI